MTVHWTYLISAFFVGVCMGFYALSLYLDYRMKKRRERAAVKQQDEFEFTIGVMQWRRVDREKYLTSSN